MCFMVSTFFWVNKFKLSSALSYFNMFLFRPTKVRTVMMGGVGTGEGVDGRWNVGT